MTEVTANMLNVKVTIETLSAGDSDTGSTALYSVYQVSQQVTGYTGHYWSLYTHM